MSSTAVSRPRVYVRIRPLNERECNEGKGEVICRGDRRQPNVLFLKRGEDGEELQTRFDHIFTGEDGQATVHDLIGPEVLRTLLSGYNASIFAYGQTGSGKTYTMEGIRGAPNASTSGAMQASLRNTLTGTMSGAKMSVRSASLGNGAVAAELDAGEGLVPRIIHGIFHAFASNPDITDAVVQISLVQIYQEHIQDLLNGRRQLEIHMDRTGQYIARDATWRTVHNVKECMRLYAEASSMRSTSATEMNLVSSRSHMIFMLKMQWDEPTLPGSHAQVNFVDLAGSERLAESGARGDVMAEAIHINKSLSALGNVVIKLVEQAKHPGRRLHIPYKDSKLTYLLQSSLGGANLIHFILAVSGSALWRGETNSTIEFGKRALQLVLRPVRNAIDYTRLAEMEAMIERMRSHIESLEEELRTKRSNEAAGFLQLRRIAQEGEEENNNNNNNNNNNEPGKSGAASPLTHRPAHTTRSHKHHLKRQTELARIMANLPETFDELTSHCVLFPESKATFREMGGLEKLIYFIDRSASTFYRANAAQTLASVLDEAGRQGFATLGGMDALTRLLKVQEERCKEAACVALEAVCRGCTANKQRLSADVYAELAELIYGYSNQQVQEMACAAVATIVDGYAAATRALEKIDVVPKLLETIRNCPAEVVNLTKAATNCVGRLAHGDKAMQQLIARFGGIDLLIDVLFSPGGDRDHQVPILASYALVNLCCSNEHNIALARAHPRYAEVNFRLLEGLARAFGTNAAREGFGRATAHEVSGPFPYYGVTVLSKWTAASSGGRPIFSTFMDNPQFYLYVRAPTDIAFIIQDTLYESRLRKKRRDNAVYMGLAIFEGDAELAKTGLKQLDFHGKMIEIGRYTSNCENVLHCHLASSETPYVVVPFTSQKGRCTSFALSAFGNQPIELTAVPEQAGWMHSVVEGGWTEFTGRSGEAFDWRCNPQLRLTPKEDCRVVFVLSYLSLDQQRAQQSSSLALQHAMQSDANNNNNNNIASNADEVVDAAGNVTSGDRPRLHGRLFTNNFAPEKRYLKAIVPLPQGSTFVASNTFSSASYITTSAVLKKGQHYVYIPFTERPYQDTFRVSVYCDSDELELAMLRPTVSEWLCSSFSGTWAGKPLRVELETTGKLVAVAYSPGTFLRVRLRHTGTDAKLAGIDSYWNTEAAVELECGAAQGTTTTTTTTGNNTTPVLGNAGELVRPNGKVTLVVEGVVRTAASPGQSPTTNKEPAAHPAAGPSPASSPVPSSSNLSSKSNAAVVGASPASSTAMQQAAQDRPFDLVLFTEHVCKVKHCDFDAVPTSWPCPTCSTSGQLLQYPRLVEDTEYSVMDEAYNEEGDSDPPLRSSLSSSSACSSSSSHALVTTASHAAGAASGPSSASPRLQSVETGRASNGSAAAASAESELRASLERVTLENARLKRMVEQQSAELEQLRQQQQQQQQQQPQQHMQADHVAVADGSRRAEGANQHSNKSEAVLPLVLSPSTSSAMNRGRETTNSPPRRNLPRQPTPPPLLVGPPHAATQRRGLNGLAVIGSNHPNNGSGANGNRRVSHTSPALPPTQVRKRSEALVVSGTAAAGHHANEPSASPVTRGATEMKESIEYTLLKLNTMNQRLATAPTSKEAMERLRRDFEELQKRLFGTLERCDEVGLRR